MTRIRTVAEEDARGIRRLFFWQAKRQYGYVPGIFKVMMPDLAVARRMGGVYDHLNLRKSSPLTRLQREMVAVVVNGHNSGAP